MEYITSVQPEQMLRYAVYSVKNRMDDGLVFTRSFIVVKNGYNVITRFTRFQEFAGIYAHGTYRPITADPETRLYFICGFLNHVLVDQGRDVTPWAHNRVWWCCAAYGHSWEASVAHRSRGINCPICANRTIIPGFNDLASMSPQLLQSWDSERNTISPSEIPPNAARKVWWKCENGHHWRCTLSNRQHGSECPYCEGRIPARTRIVP